MGRGASGSEHPLTIRVEQGNGIARIYLSGELDLSGRERFELALRTAEEQGTQVRVDLSEVMLMDSSGVSALMGAHIRANEANRELIVGGARDHVWKLFQVAGVHQVFAGSEGVQLQDASDG